MIRGSIPACDTRLFLQRMKLGYTVVSHGVAGFLEKAAAAFDKGCPHLGDYGGRAADHKSNIFLLIRNS